jgi:hypothetical protein
MLGSMSDSAAEGTFHSIYCAMAQLRPETVDVLPHPGRYSDPVLDARL